MKLSQRFQKLQYLICIISHQGHIFLLTFSCTETEILFPGFVGKDLLYIVHFSFVFFFKLFMLIYLFWFGF